MNIYPAILSKTESEIVSQLGKLEGLEDIEILHIDVIDGHLVDNITPTPLDLAHIDFGEYKIDLHLLTDEPLDFVYEAVSVKKSLPINSILAQIEHLSGQAALLEEVKKHGWKAGLSLDFHTPLDSIDESAWYAFDVIQLMSVEMGFQDQPFQKGIYDKLLELRKELALRNLTPTILVDGGVDDNNISNLKLSGVAGVAVGSFLWQAEDIQDALDRLTAES